MTDATPDLRTWLDARRREVDAALERYVPAAAVSAGAGSFLPASGRAPARVVCQARGLFKKGETQGLDPLKLIEV